MSKRIGENIKLTSGLNPAALSAGSTNGIVIDRLGFLDGKVHLFVGTASGTPTTQSVSLKLQTGDESDGSDMADVSGDVIAALTANSTEGSLNVDLEGYKRYVRIVATVAFTGGSTPAIPVAVSVALGRALEIPVL